MLELTPLESRESPVAFDVIFSPDPWFTPVRQSVIRQAVGEWWFAADPLPAIRRTDYAVVGFRGEVVDDHPAPLPADTWRVYVGTGVPASAHDALAEGGPAGYSASGSPLPRFPAGLIVLDTARLSDATLPAVVRHEAGHVVGMGHQPVATPPAWRSVMYPTVGPGTPQAMSGIEARDWLWSGHQLPKGTFVSGIGTTPGGWMIYQG